MAKVILKNVSKIYDVESKAVNNVSFKVEDKEFVVLVGPSGCGKTTTLRMIAGLEEISSGEIFIDGKLVNDIPPKDRDIAMVFQNYALYPHMTVFENMAFGLKLRNFNKAEIKNRVEEAAKILGLEDYLNRKPKALSGGQRQRVAVGRAIVRKPKVFLFDEPLSNLDAKLRVQMRTEISKLHHQLGATIIYVTHDQTEAMTMGDRIVLMKDGIINQVDTPLNLYDHPVNEFVAGFIGSPAMNFLKGKIQLKDGMYFTSRKSGLKFKLSEIQASILKDKVDKELSIGIRPENIVIENSDKGWIPIHVLLDVVEPMGNETFVYFEIDGVQFISRLRSKEAVNAGNKIHLKLDTNSILFFEGGTGNNLVIRNT